MLSSSSTDLYIFNFEFSVALKASTIVKRCLSACLTPLTTSAGLTTTKANTTLIALLNSVRHLPACVSWSFGCGWLVAFVWVSVFGMTVLCDVTDAELPCVCVCCALLACLLAASSAPVTLLIGQATMAKQGSTLQNYNNELVKCTLQQLHQTNGGVHDALFESVLTSLRVQVSRTCVRSARK